MIRVVVARHAKAVADGGPGGDHARTLSDRGRRDAARLGVRLVDRGWMPDRVWCSDAARTRETWEVVGDVLRRAGRRPEVLFERRLYLADPERVADVARDQTAAGQGEAAGCLLVVGHNPGWEQLVGFLSGVNVTLPTAGTALLECERSPGTWAHLFDVERQFRLVDLLLPNA